MSTAFSTTFTLTLLTPAKYFLKKLILILPAPCIFTFKLPYGAFGGTTKKCGNKNLSQFFLFVRDRGGKG